MGLARGAASGSLISTTTTSDVRKVLATDAACSKQHLTTYTVHHGFEMFGWGEKEGWEKI